MGLLDRINDALDWMADKIQTSTGEKNRRQLVQKLKDEYVRFRAMVIDLINAINEVISQFNDHIKKLNKLRSGIVAYNIEKLSNFLAEFGRLKSPGAYTAESEKVPAELPTQDFEKKEAYINDVDWSQSDVVYNTFFLTPLGMMHKTKGQNLSMQEQLNNMKLEFEETKRVLELKQYATEQDIEICDLYIKCVATISTVIERIIIPELNLISAFFDALAVKDAVLASLTVSTVNARKNIAVLAGTSYQKHYIFIKNAFLFYVMSCKIYNTPVLSRLLNNQIQEGDKELMSKHTNMLISQAKQLSENALGEGE